MVGLRVGEPSLQRPALRVQKFMARRGRSPAKQPNASTASMKYIHEQSTCAAECITRIEVEHPRTLFALAHGSTISCGTEDIDAGSEVPWHQHEASEEMLFCTRGTGRIHVGDEVSALSLIHI